MSRHLINHETIVLIPSLEPSETLISYVAELRKYGLDHIIIVDDGSSEAYQSIFNRLSEQGCVVLHHGVNRGKGAALKTGFRYIQVHDPHYSCVITVDSDGQHAAKDVFQVSQYAREESEEALILGIRDFSQNDVPMKSLIGNRLSSFLFMVLYGKYLKDTQTGLRAFGPQLLPLLQNVPGERFEYELQVLITCIRSGIPIRTLPIQVIYENENAGTHFRPIRDSFSIMKVMVSNFVQFVSSSIAGALVDLSLAWLLLDLLQSVMADQDFLRILIATVTARLVSIVVNYLLNKNIVFGSGHSQGSLMRYLLLSVGIMLLSSMGVYTLHTTLLISEKFSKLICDGLLFFVSYQIQRRWVFAIRR